MKKIIQILNAIFYMGVLMSVLSGTTGYAQQFDQHYLKWKAEQEAQDARLKIPRVSPPKNYYLAKPALQASTGAKISLNQANQSGTVTRAVWDRFKKSRSDHCLSSKKWKI